MHEFLAGVENILGTFDEGVAKLAGVFDDVAKGQGFFLDAVVVGDDGRGAELLEHGFHIRADLLVRQENDVIARRGDAHRVQKGDAYRCIFRGRQVVVGDFFPDGDDALVFEAQQFAEELQVGRAEMRINAGDGTLVYAKDFRHVGRRNGAGLVGLDGAGVHPEGTRQGGNVFGNIR